jgi:hypothetical protein
MGLAEKLKPKATEPTEPTESVGPEDVDEPAVAESGDEDKEHRQEHPALPQNFLTVSDLVESYRNLEKAFHEKARELRQLRDSEAQLDPEALRETLVEHRQMFLLGLQAEAERLLSIDQRISIAERAAERAMEGSQ